MWISEELCIPEDKGSCLTNAHSSKVPHLSKPMMHPVPHLLCKILNTDL